MGPVVRTSAWVAPMARFRAKRRGRYILMPERPGGHNNTIGLVGVFRVLRRFQGFVTLAFDTRKAAHISAAPETNGVAERRRGTPMALGFRTRERPCQLKVSTVVSCALCIVCLERDTPAAAIISSGLRAGRCFRRR